MLWVQRIHYNTLNKYHAENVQAGMHLETNGTRYKTDFTR